MIGVKNNLQDLATFLEKLSPEHMVEIFTDGSCDGNPGPGGWGAILRSPLCEFEYFGGEPQTTNNRMEMLAAIESIRCLPPKSHVVIHTDSRYLKDGITSWIKNWKKNGWQTSYKKPVKNQDLWQLLDQLSVTYTLEWCWVPGHAGHPENERADALAKRATIAQRMGVKRSV